MAGSTSNHSEQRPFGFPEQRSRRFKIAAGMTVAVVLLGVAWQATATDAHSGPEHHEAHEPFEPASETTTTTVQGQDEVDHRHRAFKRDVLRRFRSMKKSDDRKSSDRTTRANKRRRGRSTTTTSTTADSGDDKAPTTVLDLRPSTTTKSVDDTATKDETTTTVGARNRQETTTTTARTPSTTARTSSTDAPTRPTNNDGLWDIYTPRPGCSEGSKVPRGQGSGAVNFEPLGSIWCFDLAPAAAKTAVERSNSWVDDFTVDRLLLQLDDGDMGYRVFDGAGDVGGKSQHWFNQNHWMVDMRDAFTGGSSMRPDRSFKFQNGKLVVEADFAASIPEYGGETWGEITITSASAPTGVIADNLYAYGQFGGHWAIGCRLQSDRTPVCAIEGPRADSPPSTGKCFAIEGGYRVAEMSWFQHCGSINNGGYPTGELDKAWRKCKPDGPDMLCRDRFRMEVTKSSLTLYVNGVKYFEDANWPAAHQLPDSFVNGDVYVYQSNWQNRGGSHAFRYHWDHFAVNPPNGPEPSEWFNFKGFGG